MKVLNTIIKTKFVHLSNNNLVGNFQLFPSFFKQIEKIDDLNYEIVLYFSVESTNERPFPLNLSVAISALFTFENKNSENDIENFLAMPAVQIIYPHLRSLVSSVTASSYLQPLLLPLVDPRVFLNK